MPKYAFQTPWDNCRFDINGRYLHGQTPEWLAELTPHIPEGVATPSGQGALGAGVGYQAPRVARVTGVLPIQEVENRVLTARLREALALADDIVGYPQHSEEGRRTVSRPAGNIKTAPYDIARMGRLREALGSVLDQPLDIYPITYGDTSKPLAGYQVFTGEPADSHFARAAAARTSEGFVGAGGLDHIPAQPLNQYTRPEYDMEAGMLRAQEAAASATRAWEAAQMREWNLDRTARAEGYAAGAASNSDGRGIEAVSPEDMAALERVRRLLDPSSLGQVSGTAQGAHGTPALAGAVDHPRRGLGVAVRLNPTVDGGMFDPGDYTFHSMVRGIKERIKVDLREAQACPIVYQKVATPEGTVDAPVLGPETQPASIFDTAVWMVWALGWIYDGLLGRVPPDMQPSEGHRWVQSFLSWEGNQSGMNLLGMAGSQDYRLTLVLAVRLCEINLPHIRSAVINVLDDYDGSAPATRFAKLIDAVYAVVQRNATVAGRYEIGSAQDFEFQSLVRQSLDRVWWRNLKQCARRCFYPKPGFLRSYGARKEGAAQDWARRISQDFGHSLTTQQAMLCVVPAHMASLGHTCNRPLPEGTCGVGRDGALGV